MSCCCSNISEPSSGPKSCVSEKHVTQDTHISTTSFTEEPTDNHGNPQTEESEEVPMETSIINEKENLSDDDFQHLDTKEITSEMKKIQ